MPDGYRQPSAGLCAVVDTDLHPEVRVSPTADWALVLRRKALAKTVSELSRPSVKVGGLKFDPELRVPKSARFYFSVHVLRIGSGVGDDGNFEPVQSTEHVVGGLEDFIGLQYFSWHPRGTWFTFAGFTRKEPLRLQAMVVSLTEGVGKSGFVATQLCPGRSLNAVTGASPLSFLADGSRIICFLKESGDPVPPSPSATPTGPKILENTDTSASPARTYQNLIKSEHDEELFEYYTKSDLVMLVQRDKSGPGEAGQWSAVSLCQGEADMFTSASLSPDQQCLLVSIIRRPFSWLVPLSRFAESIQVWELEDEEEEEWSSSSSIDISKAVVKQRHVVVERPCEEKMVISFDARSSEPRNFAWHWQRPCTLRFIFAQDGGNPKKEVSSHDGMRDSLFLLNKPFALPSDPDARKSLLCSSDTDEHRQQGLELVITTPHRISSCKWAQKSELSTAFTREMCIVTTKWVKTRMTLTYIAVNVDDESGPAFRTCLVSDRSYDDIYKDPGHAPCTRADTGQWRLQALPFTGVDGSVAESFVVLGDGASPEGLRPFYDRWIVRFSEKCSSAATIEAHRLWRCPLDPDAQRELEFAETPPPTRLAVFEDPYRVSPGQGDWLLLRRESREQAPNFFWRHVESGREVQVTSFPHPQPAMRGVREMQLAYQREDGLPLNARLWLPAGYAVDSGSPRPCLLWAYPKEFKSRSNAGQVKVSPFRFVRATWSEPQAWAALGWVVMRFESPIVGEGDDVQPNDTFVEQLKMNASAAVNELIERGYGKRDAMAVGGHSYGAFMTAHLVAHTNLFSAAIARSGAYNRMLTPFGFQREERTLWEAPQVYANISPFYHADKVAASSGKLLLIHGESDSNSGTVHIQSERFYHALKGLGAETRFVSLPFEDHSYQGRESCLHALYEQEAWLEKHIVQKHFSNL